MQDFLRRIVYYLGVSILWGCTNPFIKKAQSTEQLSIYGMLLKLTDSRIFLPILLNQLGSILFYYLLATEPISFAVPIVNAMTLLITCITGYLLGEVIHSLRSFLLGAALILFGVYICLT